MVFPVVAVVAVASLRRWRLEFFSANAFAAASAAAFAFAVGMARGFGRGRGRSPGAPAPLAVFARRRGGMLGKLAPPRAAPLEPKCRRSRRTRVSEAVFVAARGGVADVPDVPTGSVKSYQPYRTVCYRQSGKLVRFEKSARSLKSHEVT